MEILIEATPGFKDGTAVAATMVEVVMAKHRYLMAAVGICALAGTVAAQAPFVNIPITAPATKEGWWIRINPTNQAGHVYWRFGVTAAALGAPVTWGQGESPQEVDAPADQRFLDRLHVAWLGLPPSAPVSLCLFYADRGIALVEFTQERNLDVDQSQAAAECVP